jgi:hypothetical protein
VAHELSFVLLVRLIKVYGTMLDMVWVQIWLHVDLIFKFSENFNKTKTNTICAKSAQVLQYFDIIKWNLSSKSGGGF